MGKFPAMGKFAGTIDPRIFPKAAFFPIDRSERAREARLVVLRRLESHWFPDRHTLGLWPGPGLSRLSDSGVGVHPGDERLHDQDVEDQAGKAEQLDVVGAPAAPACGGPGVQER